MIKTNPLSVENIRVLAEETRRKYNIKLEEYFPIMEILDRLVDEDSLNYQIVEDDASFMDDDVPAIYNASENFIYIKEYVIEEYETGNFRSAFTLAHELFHYFQVQILNFSFEEVDTCLSYENPEWQANEFAGQLLLPESYIDLENEELTQRYHVTLECVLTRKAKRLKRSKY